jgi:hypothetical protein
MAHDAFISYAGEDRVIAEAACHALEARGIRCWMAPRDLLAGKDYPEAIIDGINGAAGRYPGIHLHLGAAAGSAHHVGRRTEPGRR